MEVILENILIYFILSEYYIIGSLIGSILLYFKIIFKSKLYYIQPNELKFYYHFSKLKQNIKNLIKKILPNPGFG